MKLFKILGIYFSVILLYFIIFINFPYTHWNGITEENDEILADRIVDRIYFIFTTMSTAGYGDISPKTRVLKLITMSLQLFMIIGLFEILIDGVEK